MKHLFPVSILLLSLHACQQPAPKQDEETTIQSTKKIAIPTFHADSAFLLIEKQVSFGPRVPNTKAHDLCAAWMTQYLKQYADTVIIQKASLPAYDGKMLESQNIIASFNPQASTRIMLTAHWDTRHMADQDAENKTKPIDGANDGGSGVAILMELAKSLRTQMPIIGVDIILWDAEDYGQPANSGLPEMKDSYCLGSQYWAKNKHITNYNAKWGINLDMCGGINATFTKEQQSMYYAGGLMDRVWNNAAALGYGSIFQNKPGDGIIDDHVYINTLAQIPTIDIIDRTDNTPSGFGAYWHTQNDNLKIIDKNVLKAVGETLLYTIYEEESL